MTRTVFAIVALLALGIVLPFAAHTPVETVSAGSTLERASLPPTCHAPTPEARLVGNYVALRWERATCATSYRVLRGDVGAPMVDLIEVAHLGHVDAGAQRGASYEYALQVVLQSGAPGPMGARVHVSVPLA